MRPPIEHALRPNLYIKNRFDMQATPVLPAAADLAPPLGREAPCQTNQHTATEGLCRAEGVVADEAGGPVHEAAHEALDGLAIRGDPCCRGRPTLWDQREERALDDKVVVDHTADGHHGKASVVQLLELHVVDLLVALALQEARAELEVAGVALALEHVQHRELTAIGGALDEASQEEQRGPSSGLSRVDGLVGIRRRSEARESHKLLGGEAHSRNHADAAVLQLGLAEPPRVEGLRESKGVEALLLAHETLQARGLGQEGQALAPLHLGLLGMARCRAAPCLSLLEARAEGGAVARGLGARLSDGKEWPRLAGEHGGRDDAAVSHHGEAAIAQLLQLHLDLAGLVLGVERTQAEVSGGAVRLALVHADHGHEAEELREAEPHQHLGHAAELDHGQVGINARDLESRVVGHAHAQVRGDPAHGGEHADAAVLQLGLAEPADVKSIRETHGVKTLILATDHALKCGR
mmetsp:Transcript_102936/g.268202  ORF Transcript_102936/g.268202 Transcript_102936/m.268202 type:complete len:466 (+) Transcript_102936:82-1479(+)